MKKILILLPYIPYPLNSGGNCAVFSMIDHMRKDFTISLGFDVSLHGLISGSNAHKKELVNQLRKMWPEVTFYLYEGQKEFAAGAFKQSLYCKALSLAQASIPRKYRRAYQKWTMRNEAGDPVRANSLLHVPFPKYDAGFLQFVGEVSREGFDIIQVEMYEYLFLGYILPKNTKRVFVHHELRFVRQTNELDLFKNRYLNDTLAFEKAKSLEIGALHAYDHIVTLSETDRNILSDYIPTQMITASPAITTNMNGKQEPFHACDEFVFTGSGDHYPNKDSMLWFTQEILPILREKNISIRIHVVGRWRKEDQKTITAHNPEICFAGYIENLPAFLNGKISIIPLRIGSGIRIKILDAVQSGSPFITTYKGVEGLPFHHGKECLIADDSKSFAEAMATVLQSRQLQQRLVAQALLLFQTEYDPQKLYETRKQIYI